MSLVACIRIEYKYRLCSGGQPAKTESPMLSIEK